MLMTFPALRSNICFRFFDISFGSFCQNGQVPALSAKKQNICLNKYSPVSFSTPLETQILQDVQQTFKANITTRTFCSEFQETTKKRIIENHENQTSDNEENKLWRIDEDLYDWSCLTGCPPGFDCSEYPNQPIKPCHHGASNFETKECSNCPTGHVCIPGRLPYPCPLGQYVSAKLVNGAEKITFSGEEFAIDKIYTCNDCPRESVSILLTFETKINTFSRSQMSFRSC